MSLLLYRRLGEWRTSGIQFTSGLMTFRYSDVLNTLLEYVLDLVAELLTDVQSILNNLLGDLVGAILDLKLAPLIKSLKLKVEILNFEVLLFARVHTCRHFLF